MTLHRRILDLLGKGIGAKEFRELLDEVGSEPTLCTPWKQFIFCEFKERGISICFDTKLQAFDYAHLYIVPKDGYANYSGDLPAGLSTMDTSAQLCTKIGLRPKITELEEQNESYYLFDVDGREWGFSFERSPQAKLIQVYFAVPSKNWPYHRDFSNPNWPIN